MDERRTRVDVREDGLPGEAGDGLIEEHGGDGKPKVLPEAGGGHHLGGGDAAEGDDAGRAAGLGVGEHGTHTDEPCCLHTRER